MANSTERCLQADIRCIGFEHRCQADRLRNLRRSGSKLTILNSKLMSVRHWFAILTSDMLYEELRDGDPDYLEVDDG